MGFDLFSQTLANVPPDQRVVGIIGFVSADLSSIQRISHAERGQAIDAASEAIKTGALTWFLPHQSAGRITKTPPSGAAFCMG